MRTVGDLTERELDVLELMARGLTNPQIAAKLLITRNTVKGHVAHMLGKLHARNRAHLVALGYETGLLVTTTRAGEDREMTLSRQSTL